MVGVPDNNDEGATLSHIGYLYESEDWYYNSRIPSLCTRCTRAGIEWCCCHRAVVWRGHAKTPTTRAGPWPDFALRLE